MADNKRDFEALLKRLAAPRARRPSQPPLALVPGLAIAGSLRVVKLLGRGGMGEVYEAIDLRSEKPVAIKCLLPALAEDAKARERFEAEALASGRLGHPHILQVFGTGTLPDGRPYLTMELSHGPSLQEALNAGGPLGEARLLPIAGALCDALQSAHAHGLVHRDLKPANVMLDLRDGEECVKLTDFGVAKLIAQPGARTTTTGVVLGTPHFMAPEQIRGDREIDGRADLYSLGVLLYYCATGRFPFQGKTFAELAVQICCAPVPAPSALAGPLSRDFDGLVATAMQRDPARRFASAHAFKAALEQAQEARAGSLV